VARRRFFNRRGDKPAKTRPEVGYQADEYTRRWGVGGRLDALKETTWPYSVKTYSEMRKEPQIASMIDAVTGPIMAAGWHVVPNGADPEAVALVADDLGLPVRDDQKREIPARERDRFDFQEHLQLAVVTKAVFGHSFFETVFRTENGRTHLHKAAWRPPETISKIEVDRDGGLVAIEQWPAEGVKHPRMLAQDLLCYVNRREGTNWFGQSYLERCYPLWAIKNELLRINTMVIQRNGMGFPVYSASPPLEGEPAAKAREEAKKELDRALKLVEHIRAGDAAGVTLPAGAEFHLVGVTGRLPDILASIEYCDRMFAVAFLAQVFNLGQASGTGSYALGDVLDGSLVRSIDADAAYDAAMINRHLVEPLVDKNWGPTARAPKVAVDPIGSRHPVTAEAIYQLVQCGAILPEPNLEKFLRGLFGIPEQLPRDQWPYPPKTASDQSER
jgi:hypothetical protein